MSARKYFLRYRAITGEMNEDRDPDGIHLYINAIERTRLVVADTLKVVAILTRQVDSAYFTLRKFGDRTFRPEVGQTVSIKNGAAKIFGGRIVRIQEVYGKLDYVDYQIECADFTRDIDHKLVITSFEGQNVANIITTIANTYFPASIALDIQCSTVIDYIAFNYELPSECLQQLADLTGYDWYVDYDRVLHFFSKTANNAPWNLSDTGGKYIYESLRLHRDITPVRNTVYVRGGEFKGDTFTVSVVGDGTQRVFGTQYRFSNLQVTVTGVSKAVGVDYLDEETEFDLLYNFQEKLVRFRADRIPRNGSTVKIFGNPWLPVLIKIDNKGSIGDFAELEGQGMGEYEYRIIDKSIKNKEGARQRANAELLAYASTLVEGEFETYENDLRTGQRIQVQSDLRNLDEYYVINRIETRLIISDNPNNNIRFHHKISLISARTFDHIDLLRKLLNKDSKEITVTDDEILETIESESEAMTISEVVTSELEHNPQTEEVSMVSTSYFHDFNYGVQWVLGPYTPTISLNGADTKRVFLLNGSYLA